jgi:hypothetical protein
MTKFLRPIEKNGIDQLAGKAFSIKKTYNVRFPNGVLVLGISPKIDRRKYQYAYFEIIERGRPVSFRSTDLEIECE